MSKIIFQIRFINPIEEILEIQNSLHLLGPNDGDFELDGILCYELNKRVNFFLLDNSKIKLLESFLDYVGLKYLFIKREVKEFYDSVKFTYLNEYFKKAIEDEIISNTSVDNILDKINKKGINSLTPLDKFILNN